MTIGRTIKIKREDDLLKKEGEYVNEEYSRFQIGGEKLVYFISFAWKNQQNCVSLGNVTIEDSPLKWLKEKQDALPNGEVRLLWWIQLTKKEDIEAANSIGQTAI